MIKLSATQIDAYVKFTKDEISQDMLHESLLRTGKSNVKMELGSIFHSLIEDKDAKIPQNFFLVNYDNKEMESSTRYVPLFDAKQIADIRKMFTHGIHESKQRMILRNGAFGEVMLTGVADYLYGNTAYEFKTAWGAFSIDRYIDSLQWRIYCMMFGVNKIEYYVFKFPSLSKSINEIQDIDKTLVFDEMHNFTMYANESNSEYVIQTIRSLIEYINASELREQMDAEYEASEFTIFK